MTAISCNKKPTADFSTDKLQYVAGETIKLTNKSDNAKSYKWTFYDGQSSTSKDVNFETNEYSTSGQYPIRLEVYSRNEKKYSQITKDISISAATGSLTIWTSNQSVALPIYVYIDGQAVDEILYWNLSTPDCNDDNTSRNKLTTGNHTITATSGQLFWTANVLVKKDECLLFKLP